MLVPVGVPTAAANAVPVNSDRTTPANMAPASLTVLTSFMTISSLRGALFVYTLGPAATRTDTCLPGWPLFTWLWLPAGNPCLFDINPGAGPHLCVTAAP